MNKPKGQEIPPKMTPKRYLNAQGGIENLKDDYKYVFQCIECGRDFGADRKNQRTPMSKHCPICIMKNRHKRNTLHKEQKPTGEV